MLFEYHQQCRYLIDNSKTVQETETNLQIEVQQNFPFDLAHKKSRTPLVKRLIARIHPSIAIDATKFPWPNLPSPEMKYIMPFILDVMHKACLSII